MARSRRRFWRPRKVVPQIVDELKFRYRARSKIDDSMPFLRTLDCQFSQTWGHLPVSRWRGPIACDEFPLLTSSPAAQSA
jgi:hypothetical protein